MKSQNKLYDIVFILLLALAAFFTIPYHQGFLLGDDYLGAANQLLHGNWDIENNFWANRIGSYLPYAIGIWFGGVGIWLTFITTVEFLLLLVMVYIIIKKNDVSTGFIAAFLLGISTAMHQNAGVVMGDMAATLTVNAVVLAYFWYSFYVTKNKSNAKKWGVIMALLVLIAFLVKESVVFYFPVLVWLYWNDLKQPTQKTVGKYFMFFSCMFGLAIIIIYWLKTGDPLYRIHVVEGGPNESDCNYASADWLTLFNRITWQPFQFLVEKYAFGCLLLLSVLQLLIPANSNNPAEKFFKIYFIGTLAMWWAGSQGLSSYNPVAFVDRLWLPLLVPIAINGAFFVQHVLQGHITSKVAKRVTALVLLFLAASLGSLYISYLTYRAHPELTTPNLTSVAVWYSFISVSIILAIYTNVILDIIPSVKSMFFCILIFPFVSGGFQEILVWADKKNKGVKNGFDSEKEMVQYAVSLKPRLLITDYRVAHFYYAYIMDMDKKLPIADYNFVSIDTIKKGDYLLLNPERQIWFEKNINVTLTYTKAHYDIVDFVKNPEKSGFFLVKENETDRLYRYEGLSKN